MLEDIVLHDMIVTMGIYTQCACPFKSPFEHTIPYPMHIRPTRHTQSLPHRAIDTHSFSVSSEPYQYPLTENSNRSNFICPQASISIIPCHLFEMYKCPVDESGDMGHEGLPADSKAVLHPRRHFGINLPADKPYLFKPFQRLGEHFL